MSPPVKHADSCYKLLKEQNITYFIDYHTRSTNKEGHPITVYKIN